MTRIIVAVEGIDIGDGRSIKPGALTWAEEDGIPVAWSGNYAAPIGTATNFQREEDGSITANVEITSNESIDFAGLDVTPYISPFESAENDINRIVRGTIRAVSVGFPL